MKISRNIFVLTIIGSISLMQLTSCSDFLSVDNPSSLTEEDINQASEIDVLANSAEGNVLNGYSLAILSSGMVGDGIMAAGTQTAYIRMDEGYMDIQRYGSRDFALDQTYNALSEGRWTANFAAKKINELSKKKNDTRIAKAKLFEAFSLILLADNWRQITIDGKAPITPVETYLLARSKLKESLSIVSSEKNELQVPILGLLSRVNYSLAVESEDGSYMIDAVSFAQQALDLNDKFKFEGAYNKTSQPNEIFAEMNRGQLEASTGKIFIKRKDIYTGEIDPRVKYGNFEKLSPSADSIYLQQKYPSYNASIPIVKWQEMNLILAENELNNERIDSAIEYLNQNRREDGLPDLATQDLEQAYDFLIYERGTELWLEGRRWFDMRHFNLPFVRWSDASKAAGTDRKFPIPETERNANNNLN